MKEINSKLITKRIFLLGMLVFFYLLFFTNPNFSYGCDDSSCKENKLSLVVNSEKIENKKTIGPVGPPSVKGPTSPPPTSEEVRAMKLNSEEGSDNIIFDLFNKIWNFIKGFFN